MKTLLLTAATMLAFASNSLLCRAALADAHIDAVSFTTIRIVSGALALWLIVAVRNRPAQAEDRRPPKRAAATAAVLLVYAFPFSLAYLALGAGTGALILFGAVQLTMIVGGLQRGERPTARRWIGLALAMGGLVYLVSPGITAPDAGSAVLMAVAGVAWGLFSLLGSGVRDPLRATRGNFVLAMPVAVLVSLIVMTVATSPTARAEGVVLAITSGALASGVGYALWYAALRGLKATTAAVVQLSVPVIAALGGVLLLSEAFTARLGIASIVTLGGIALAVVRRPSAPRAPDTPEQTDPNTDAPPAAAVTDLSKSGS